MTIVANERPSLPLVLATLPLSGHACPLAATSHLSAVFFWGNP